MEIINITTNLPASYHRVRLAEQPGRVTCSCGYDQQFDTLDAAWDGAEAHSAKNKPPITADKLPRLEPQ